MTHQCPNSEKPGGFSHDDFAWKLASCLLEDFKPFVSDSFYLAAREAFTSRTVEKVRALTCGSADEYQPYQLKTTRQLCELFKKFSFSQDLYTPAELLASSKEKFLENQLRLSNLSADEYDPVTREILFTARGYVDQICGEFSALEICERATFGKKSSVGVPMRKACEGARYEGPITGSEEMIEWFDKYYGIWNRPALEYARMRAKLLKKPPYRSVNLLEAVLVDKTWKSLRMIMPNTTFGTLYSGGLGRTIEERLRSYGYDIKHLQPVHGELARIGSITGTLVTADQSMASDNITVKLIDDIFPRRWASALKFGRIADISLYGTKITTPTFSTMGIGFTFPLQTLVFLALLLAIRDYCMLDEQTVVSVFGDDLIYDDRMHPVVMDVFPKLGLVINADKTFATGNFRESCGYDYYRGVDVRPFLLGRANRQSAGKRRSEAYLYTALNGLLRRWEVYEVPSASNCIVEAIRQVRGTEPLVVPTDYPDTAGAKVSFETALLLGIKPSIKKNKHGLYNFRCLAFEPELRKEVREYAYLMAKLRTHPGVVSDLPFSRIKAGVKQVGDLVYDAPRTFTFVGPKDPRCSPKLPKESRLSPQIPNIPQQDIGRFRERSGVSGNWTPGRRTGP